MRSKASRIIPKGQFSTYRHWEMDAFEQPLPAPVSPSAPTPDDRPGGQGEDEHVPAHVTMSLPTVDEIERMHLQAQDEGYAAGYEAGRETGLKAGREHAEAEAMKLQALLRSFDQALADADQAIGHDLLTLALTLAKQMVREALRIKPELVCSIVRECLRQEPAFSQPAQLLLHPEDAVLVREHMGHELNDCGISVDPQLERGGCRVKIGNGHIDAVMATRWNLIARALGQHDDWLER
ncbi:MULTISPECIES: flagellar assembly protein FliH [unclassified Nitrosospira]|jgi:flagellar assembly protein FliH|uniref:flagellar assembly protein FliH n=1 Tax=unclassified Nitrosospira TaxID=2609267 RepID=UPI000D31FE3C|nr:MULTISPECIES: flagellar assembly protein FliH [unclassified Nitrosospira]PTR16408.1 flagellar assembly protein FliH [Nitrosospira sp. Nsp2]WON73609.1 flagellar assembly protein FliH [Nitrosospira sp. Is2]